MTGQPGPVRYGRWSSPRSGTPRREPSTIVTFLGDGESVGLSARRKGDAGWKRMPLRPYPNRAYIGALLCGPNDTLRPGQEMPPNHARLVDGAPKAKRITFTEGLDQL